MSEEGYGMIGEGYAKTGEVKGLCIKCKFYNSGDPITNCYENNTYKEFAKRHKVIVIVAECKDFKKQEPIIIEEEAQEEEQILIQTEAEAEKEMTKQADEAEVQQELETKGGHNE